MERTPFLFSSVVLAAMLALLASCDSSSNSNKDDPPSSKDTVMTPAGTVAAPVFSPSGGSYSTPLIVMISSTTSGAAIHYTTDGSAPTSASTMFTFPVTVGATQTLKAIAVKSGLATSSVVSVTYTISGGFSATIPWNTSITYGSLSYGGQNYKTVVIGTQTWMAENLNYKVDSSWWYANSVDSGARYGRWYTWAAAMKLPDSCNRVACASQVSSKHQGVCPTGWHVPSWAEWSTLVTYVGGEDAADLKLKSTSGWIDFYNGSDNGTDSYGFRAIPASYHGGDESDFCVGGCAFFWTSTEDNTGLAWVRSLYSGPGGMGGGNGDKDDGFSVRCLKDTP